MVFVVDLDGNVVSCFIAKKNAIKITRITLSFVLIC